MRQRGKQSVEAKATLTAIVDRRPPPPSDLPAYAAEVWREVVGSMAHDWFRPSQYALLAAYCRHTWHAHEVDKLIAEWLLSTDNEMRRQIPELLKTRERESRAMLALARSMRITHQAQHGPRTAERKQTTGGQPLWQR